MCSQRVNDTSCILFSSNTNILFLYQLTPVERYAMRFVEETEAAWSAEQLAAAEREIEKQKREWEENRLAALRKEEERRKNSLEEEQEMLTFSREDSTNQVRSTKKSLRKFKRGKRRLISHNKRDSVRLEQRKGSINLEKVNTRLRSCSGSFENENRKVKIDDKGTLNVTVKKRKVKLSCNDNEIDDKLNDKLINKCNKNSLNCDKIVTRRGRKSTLTNSDIDNLTTKKTEELSSNETTEENEKSEIKNEELDDNKDSEKSSDEEYSNVDEYSSESSDDKPLILKKSESDKPKRNVKLNIKNNKVISDASESESDNEMINNHIDDDNSDISQSESESDYSNSSDNVPLKSSPKIIANKVDADSPRTRSRGTVKINLWTLDVSPILPGVKPIIRSNTPLPKNKKKLNNRSDNGKIKNKIHEEQITVCAESIEETKLIENCINSEPVVTLTRDICVTDTVSDVNSNSGTETKVTDSPKFRKPQIRKNKRSNAQKQTLDKWLTKSEDKRRKNSDSESEPAKKLKVENDVDSDIIPTEKEESKENNEEINKSMDVIDAEIISQIENTSFESQTESESSKKVVSRKMRKKSGSDTETMNKNKKNIKKIKKNSVSDSETNNKITKIFQSDNKNNKTNKIKLNKQKTEDKTSKSVIKLTRIDEIVPLDKGKQQEPEMPKLDPEISETNREDMPNDDKTSDKKKDETNNGNKNAVDSSRKSIKMQDSRNAKKIINENKVKCKDRSDSTNGSVT